VSPGRHRHAEHEAAWMIVSTVQSRLAPDWDSWKVSRAISPSAWSRMLAIA
jgi:hypothetical protein